MSSLVLSLTSDAAVRSLMAPDGTHRFSVYDFITLACQKTDGSAYASKTYSNLGLQRLLFMLGTKVAAEFRRLLEGTSTRVMAGDTSLIEVIQANTAFDAPIHQAYHQGLEQEPVDDETVEK